MSSNTHEKTSSDHGFKGAIAGLIAIIVAIIGCKLKTGLLAPVDYFIIMIPTTSVSMLWCFKWPRVAGDDVVEPRWWWMLQNFLVPLIAGTIMLLGMLGIEYLQQH